MGIRLSYLISFTYPVHAVTSGFEQESLFALWKFVKGMTLYSNPYSPPYSIAFFNWLYYQTYGPFTSTLLNILQLGDDWIPAVSRWMSLIGASIGSFMAYKAMVAVTETQSNTMRQLCLCLAIYLMFGPLVGFWAFTIRPDIWGMVFDMSAVFVFWKFYPKHQYRAAIFASILLFCSWSFKHVDIFSAVCNRPFLVIS